MTHVDTASTFMLLLGMAALGFGIRWARTIIALQPSKASWRVLIGLMFGSLISYAVVALGFSVGVNFDLKWTISVTLLASAVFVSIVTRVSLSTVDNLLRVHIDSITDSLTGTFNRRFAEQRLLEEISRAHRYNRPLSLLLFDLDRFKLINDSFGHLYGDNVLKTVAELIKGKVRNCDYFCRFGGEEFLVILTETDLAGASIVAERMREGVEQHSFPLAAVASTTNTPYPLIESTRVKVTISVGVSALLTRSDDTANAILERVDHGLYQCKNAGRNAVSVIQPAPKSA
ncbi:MAG TPA: GGDEF domain-containing protein [Polyangiaceae bacterium]|nr:GGDEF domain-containing protein [Polyangiaceae bacterium]